MSSPKKILHVLLMDDDPEVLQQLVETLPENRNGYSFIWEECDDFDEAFERVSNTRYDVVVTDLYRDQKGKAKDTEAGAAKGLATIDEIRKRRFCPIVAFSDGSIPEGFPEGPFIKFADKSRGNDDILAKMDLVLETGVPEIARKLHDELDGAGAEYLWGFLEQNWENLKASGLIDQSVTERLIRRRASIQLSRLTPDSKSELAEVEGLEFYIYPKISLGEYRLGEIIRRKGTDEFRVILTPHCHLTVQTGEKEPRANMVLTVKTIMALTAAKEQKWPKEENDRNEKLRRRIKAPPEMGKPEGRYWFLPGFLKMPDLYCDFMAVESLQYSDVVTNFDPIAVLDAPYAEALQASFGRFYSAVGICNLRTERFVHLIPKS